jgi:hypothetical protein
MIQQHNKLYFEIFGRDRKFTGESMTAEPNYDRRAKIMVGFRPPTRKSGEIFYFMPARTDG